MCVCVCVCVVSETRRRDERQLVAVSRSKYAGEINFDEAGLSVVWCHLVTSTEQKWQKVPYSTIVLADGSARACGI